MADGQENGPASASRKVPPPGGGWIHVVAPDGMAVPVRLRRLIASAEPVTELREASSVASLADRDDGTPVLQLHLGPAAAMARAVAAGQAPAEALAAWTAETGALLAACRRMRRRITLLELGHAAAATPALAEALGARLGLTLSAPKDTPGDAPPGDAPEDDAADALSLLLAEAALARDAQARRLADELDAMTLPLGGAPEGDAELPGRGFAELAAQRDRLGQLAAETGAQGARIARLEAEAAAHRTEAEATARRTAELEATAAEARALMQQAAAASEEAAALRRELAALQAEAPARSAAQAAAETALRAEIARLARNEAVLAAQLLRFGVRGDGLADDLETTRATAESAGADVARLEAELASEQEAHAATRAALEAETDRMRAAEAERARLEAALAEARAELAHIRASRSWRITGPMRAVGRTLRKEHGDG